MPRRPATRWTLLIAINVVSFCVLSFYRPGYAAPPQRSAEPFANATQQRFEIIEQLKQINEQLRQQNTLLRSGKNDVARADEADP